MNALGKHSGQLWPGDPESALPTPSCIAVDSIAISGLLHLDGFLLTQPPKRQCEPCRGGQAEEGAA